MTASPECVFEEEVLAAALQSRWPRHVSPELRKHVAVCALCSDVAEAATAVASARAQDSAPTDLPDAGRIWWITQFRMRREAMKNAVRPITAAQVAAIGCVAGLAGACFGATSAWFQRALAWLNTVGSSSATALIPWAQTFIGEHGAVALAAAIFLIVLPAAFYLALGRE
jgi:hypothetical protein